MKKQLLLTIITLLLLVTPAFATQYITVVGEEAPTSDVVTATNFAFSMTGLGLTFTGRIDTELLDQDPSFDDTYYVVIDGNDVRLIGSTQYGMQIMDYFEDQGFSVQRIHNPSLEDLRLTPEPVIQELTPTINETSNETIIIEEPTVQENMTQEEPETCMGCSYNGDCLSQGSVVNNQYCDGLELQMQKNDGDTCSQDYECLIGSCSNGTCGEERPGIITRVLRWFANIF